MVVGSSLKCCILGTHVIICILVTSNYIERRPYYAILQYTTHLSDLLLAKRLARGSRECFLKQGLELAD